MFSPRPQRDFRVLRVLPSPPFCWSIFTLSKSPSLLLSRKREHLPLHALHFLHGQSYPDRITRVERERGLSFVDSVENPCAVDILARSSRSPQSFGRDASTMRPPPQRINTRICSRLTAFARGGPRFVAAARRCGVPPRQQLVRWSVARLF